jgi:hypothetical protein
MPLIIKSLNIVFSYDIVYKSVIKMIRLYNYAGKWEMYWIIYFNFIIVPGISKDLSPT